MAKSKPEIGWCWKWDADMEGHPFLIARHTENTRSQAWNAVRESWPMREGEKRANWRRRLHHTGIRVVRVKVVEL